MGNTKGKERKEFQVKVNHSRFLNSKIVTLKDKKYLQTTFTIHQKEYEKWKLSINKIEQPPLNLFLPVSYRFNRTAMCGHTGSAIVQYPNNPYLLTEEVYDRKGKKSSFSQVQLWFLLYSLVRANGQACKIKQQLVDLRPNNIFLNQDGNIKVSTNLSWPYQTSNLQKAMDKQRTYLAPQDLDTLSRGETLQQISEVALAFSMGLTALSVGNLSNYQELYDMQSCRFDGERMEDALNEWRRKQSFSEVLKGTVSLLCSRDPERRMTVAQLHDLLLKHHQNIQAKTNFVVDNAPQKLHQEIMLNRKLVQRTQWKSQVKPQAVYQYQQVRDKQPVKREVVQQQVVRRQVVQQQVVRRQVIHTQSPPVPFPSQMVKFVHVETSKTQDNSHPGQSSTIQRIQQRNSPAKEGSPAAASKVQ